VLFDEVMQLQDEVLGDNVVDLWNISIPLSVRKAKPVGW
jgi:hypothetical protein